MKNPTIALGGLVALTLATAGCFVGDEPADPESSSDSAVSTTADALRDWYPIVSAEGLLFSADSAEAKLRGCPNGDPSQASLAVFHAGGNGSLPVPENEAWPPSAAKSEALENLVGTLHQIRAYLRPICVRLVVVGTGASPSAADAGYFAGQPSQRLAGERPGDFARRRQEYAAGRLRRGIDFVFTHFPSAPSYTYLGGSMSSVLGASMVNDFWSADAQGAAMTRLRRVIVSGVAAGNFLMADASTSPRPAATTCPAPKDQSGGFSCALAGVAFAELGDTPVSDGNLFPPGRGLSRFLAAGGKLNMFSGTEDALFGYPRPGAWTGPEGVANFQEQAHVPCGHVDCSDDAASEGSVGVTNANLPGATHTNTWTFPKRETAAPGGSDSVPHYMCRRIAYDLHPTWSQAKRTAVCSRPAP